MAIPEMSRHGDEETLKEIRDALARMALTQADQAANIQHGFKEVHGRQDITNGNLHKHDARLLFIEQWKIEQDKIDAYRRGIDDGKTSLRSRDLAIIAAFIAVISGVASFTPGLIEFLR